MCSQPPRKTHIDLFKYFTQACLLADPNSNIGLSGGEPTLYKEELFELLMVVLTARPDLSFHVLTNAQHFCADDTYKIAKLSDRVMWGVPIYSDIAQQHDEIVGKKDAFSLLEQGLSTLLEGFAPVELRTVILKSNAARLPELSHWVCSNLQGINFWAIMQLERQGFARNRWDELFYDHSRDFEAIGSAVAIAQAKGIATYLYNMPRCTIPLEYREFAPPTISDWKQGFALECNECVQQDVCSGIFAWHNGNVPFEKWGRL